MHQRILLLPGKPNFRCLSCSTHKFTLPSLSKHFLSLVLLIILMSNNFLFSDDDNLKKDAVVVPLSSALTTPKGCPQEETVVAKPSPVLPKKNPTAPPLKRQTKAAAVAAYLEVHQPSSSSEHVSIASYN
jgi:hypothetical protein